MSSPQTDPFSTTFLVKNWPFFGHFWSFFGHFLVVFWPFFVHFWGAKPPILGPPGDPPVDGPGLRLLGTPILATVMHFRSNSSYSHAFLSKIGGSRGSRSTILGAKTPLARKFPKFRCKKSLATVHTFCPKMGFWLSEWKKVISNDFFPPSVGTNFRVIRKNGIFG